MLFGTPVQRLVRQKRTFSSTAAHDGSADFADLRFSNFADAASACSCGTCSVAMLRMSLLRSFTGVDLKKTETVLSPQTCQMGKTRTNRVFACAAFADAAFP
jgi:hypothetical protein